MTGDKIAARVRKYIFECFRASGTPPVVEQVMTRFALTRGQATETLRELEDAHHISLVPGTARILMAFPFSAIATPFKVTVGGDQYFANCAWDAVAFHTMLRQNVQVDSFCDHCAEPVRIDLSEGRATLVEPAGAMVYLARTPSHWWDDITTTCGNTMVFFSSAEHRDASSLCETDGHGASLTPAQVLALSEPIYATKFDLDYTRPTAAELAAHFTEIGLTDPYWQR
ncbi:MAG: organomercurial lyase [Chloroflexota bacterium]